MASLLSSRLSQIRRWAASWTHHRDHLLALVVVLTSVSLLPLRLMIGHIYARTFPPTLIIAAVAYLCATRWLPARTEPDPDSATRQEYGPPTLSAWASRVAPILVCWLLVATLAVTLYSATTPGTLPEGLVSFDIGRGLGIYLLTAAAGSLVLAQIAYVRERDFAPRFLLAQLLAVCGILRFSAFILTPSYIGVDIFTHAMNYAAVMLDTGSLQAGLGGSKYIAAPLYHLLVVATALLGNVGLQWAVYLSVGVAMLCAPVFVYCGARRLPGVGARWALFGAALFGLMDYVTYWTVHAIPSSLALVFSLGILVLVIRVLTTPHPFTVTTLHSGISVCIGLLCLGIVLTDQVTSFIILVMFGTGVGVQLVLYIGRWLSDGLASSSSAVPVPSIFASLLGSAGAGNHSSGMSTDTTADVDTQPLMLADMTTYAVFMLGLTLFVWGMTPYHGTTFTESVIRVLTDTIAASTGDGQLFAEALSRNGTTSASGAGGNSRPIEATLMLYGSQLGVLLLLGASVIGTCAIVRRRSRSVPVPNQANLTLIGIVIVIGIFAFVPAMVGIGTFLTGRWYAVLYAGMGLLVASGFAQLWNQDRTGADAREADRQAATSMASDRPRSPNGGREPNGDSDGNRSSHVQYQPLAVCILLIICVHPLAGAVSVDATLDAPVREDAQPRYAFTSPEEQAAETLIDITASSEDHPIYTDSEYAMRLTRPDPGPSVYYTAVVNDTGVSGDHDRIIYRTYQFEGAPSFVDPTTGQTRIRQLTHNTTDGARDVCRADQSLLYDNQHVQYCSDP